MGHRAFLRVRCIIKFRKFHGTPRGCMSAVKALEANLARALCCWLAIVGAPLQRPLRIDAAAHAARSVVACSGRPGVAAPSTHNAFKRQPENCVPRRLRRRHALPRVRWRL
eukprot:7376518-Prymnesium_polylepis.2